MPPASLAPGPRPRAALFASKPLTAAGKASDPLVLAVDPQLGMQRLLVQELSVQGFHVIIASTGSDALELAERRRPDVVLTEEALPDTCGLELMRLLRQRSSVPVIFLTGSSGQADKVRALEAGADDYIEKPFDSLELASRIRAVLRRSMGSHELERVVEFDGVTIDLNRRLVRKDGQLVDLTRSEWLLLERLAANAGRVIVNEELLTSVWGPEYRPDLQYLRVWISRLRHKLEPASGRTIIKTIKGIGYVLDTATSPTPAAVAS